MPSIDAMLTILEGSSEFPFFSSNLASFWVIKNGLFRFRSTTLSHPSIGYSSKGAPHAAPALLIRKSMPSGSFSVKKLLKLVMPSSFERSTQKGMHSALYSLLSSSAFVIKASSFLAVI